MKLALKEQKPYQDWALLALAELAERFAFPPVGTLPRTPAFRRTGRLFLRFATGFPQRSGWQAGKGKKAPLREEPRF
jgi:hypothetical protein